MEENLFLEETQKSVLQTKDVDEYDPNASLQNPEGYTPVGEGEDNTPVESVEPNNIGEVSATTPVLTSQVSDLPSETYGGFGDDLVIDNNTEITLENANSVELTLLSQEQDVSFSAEPEELPVEIESPVEPEPPVEPPVEPET
jgi:hypothetical protein